MRWLRKHPTMALAAACVILLVGIVATGIALSSSVNSLTVDDVTTEVTSGMDELQAQLSAPSIVSAADTIRTEPCPDGGKGTLVAVERSIVVVDGFDLNGWVRELSATYSAKEGWSATLDSALGPSTLTLANRSLMLFTLEAFTAEQPQGLVMKATSRCSTVD
ncbi:hypothetical protein SAMN06295879_2255 [Agreia bicolorata]|uniref:Uncharacterized protein n=1 Tax=Agreia bicolorata TaxID=110935 RepID=A0A1T4Y3X3_9MICO|nr:hypothetical protein [Agreia bicolorata]SKA96499.1 hypothetical protein SAMN06295879_2255 [Agreia bicolorata]